MKRIRVQVLVFRGGAWRYYAGCARCAHHCWGSPGDREDAVGFRCCFSPLFVKINKRKARK